MAKIVAVVNQKGGVGKTTTSVNLAASVAFRGAQETLIVDLDPQGNATSGLGIDKNNLDGSSYDIFSGGKPLSTIIQPTAVEFLEMVPSHIDLVGTEVELVDVPDRELKLRQALEPYQSVYKYIFLDCPPSLGLLTVNALCAAQTVLIPIQCEFYALEGLSQLMQTIARVRQSLNPDLDVEGVIFTMYDSRMKLANDVVGEVKKVFQDKVYNTYIPRNVRLAEAPSFGKPALLYDFTSRGAQSYLNLSHEFLNRNGVRVESDADKTQEVALS